METTVKEIKDDGLIVELMDGSVWMIEPTDAGKTAYWFVSQRVKVEESEDGSYSLTNLDTAEPYKVQASRSITLL